MDRKNFLTSTTMLKLIIGLVILSGAALGAFLLIDHSQNTAGKNAKAACVVVIYSDSEQGATLTGNVPFEGGCWGLPTPVLGPGQIWIFRGIPKDYVKHGVKVGYAYLRVEKEWRRIRKVNLDLNDVEMSVPFLPDSVKQDWIAANSQPQEKKPSGGSQFMVVAEGDTWEQEGVWQYKGGQLVSAKPWKDRVDKAGMLRLRKPRPASLVPVR